jgi:hypothetical protein
MPANYVQIPDWFSAEDQGSGIAVADLANNGQQDLIVFMVDAPPGQNRGLFRIGRNLDAAGHVTGAWTPWIDIPDWFAWENQGAGIAVADLDHDGKQDLVVFMIDQGLTQNQGYYRVGKMLDVNGNVNGGWGPWIPIPDWFSRDNQYGSIALADLDGDGSFELLVIMVDNPAQQNRGLYRIGRKLDMNGNVTGAWTPWIDVPDWFPWDNQGAGLTVLDLDNTGRHDLIVFMIDNAMEQNQAFYKIAKDIDLNGQAAGGWSLWRGVPAWFSWENQGGSIAALLSNGKPAMVVMMVDNPPGQNAGWYRVLPLDDNPQRDGQWQLLPYHSGVLAVHAALCPTGKVLFFAGSGSSATRFGSPDFGNMAKGIFTSVVWDPAAAPPNNFFHPNTIIGADGRPFDFFCGGDTFLPDGRLLSAGGTVGYNPFRGRQDATVFDPKTQQWSFVKNMAHGRWYPTLITLGDGRVLAATGLTEDFDEPHNETIEIYSAATNTWELHTFFPEFPGLPLYAHLFLLADGRILFNGGRMDDELPVDPCLIDMTKQPIHTVPVPGGSGGGMRNQSASVIMPPAQDQRVMLIGGGPAQKPNKTDAIDNVDIVDLKEANPHFVPGAPLNLPRLHLNAVLLPDRTVLATGGSLKQEDQPLARLQSEIYDPATDTWTLTAACTVPRLYHSTALLFPDGRVVTAGGNPEGGTHVQWDQDDEEEMRLELFSPPYLFRGSRPSIAAVPEQWTYGQQVNIGSPQAGTLRWAHLMRNGVTTHSFDMNQRLVDLPIASQINGILQVSVPTNPNIAPPGWYMLFIVDQHGVPSVARWIHLH